MERLDTLVWALCAVLAVSLVLSAVSACAIALWALAPPLRALLGLLGLPIPQALQPAEVYCLVRDTSQIVDRLLWWPWPTIERAAVLIWLCWQWALICGWRWLMR